MNRPLYSDTNTQWPTGDLPSDGHAGLWFDRFFNKYDSIWRVPKDDSGKLAWIETVTKGKIGGDTIAAFGARQNRLVSALKGQTIFAKTDWHFATGLGNDHPVENGFAWHPTLGVPYLTGAAVKGLLRSWCGVWSETFLKNGEDPKAKLRLWFGPSWDDLNPRKGSGITKMNPSAGELIFFDALPTGPVTLKPDVMTPHMGDWYEKGNEDPNPDGSNVPADWHSPVPVPFLVVAPGQVFRFSVATRPGSAIVVDDVVKELKSALAYLGAGAKTAVGYGRFDFGEEMSHPATGFASPASLWVDGSISEIVTKHNSRPDDALRGRLLVEAWNAITDADLKAAVLKEIERRWRKSGLGWGDKPLSGGAKKAFAVYGGQSG